MKIRQCLTIGVMVVLLNACATYNPYYKNTTTAASIFPKEKEILHSFYLIGDAGKVKINDQKKRLEFFKDKLTTASKNSTALFLGDNIYPKGLPEKDSPERKLAIEHLDAQINTVKNFKGRTIFIPGNHDWYSGLKGVKRQEKYIENKLGANTFLPENGCPLRKVKINEAIDLVIVDSYWYIANWDKHPNINNNCDIKTRHQFFEEFESLIKKARGKTTLVAIHHPLFTQGPHGGQFSLKQNLKPTPVLGFLKNLIRKTGGIVGEDQIGKRYQELKKRVVTLSQENEKVILVSGHEHSLQYIVKNNLPQIVSGSGAKESATRLLNGGHFAHGTHGFVQLDVFKDGSSYARFYSAKDKKVIFQTTVHSKDVEVFKEAFNTEFPKTAEASIYTSKQVKKNFIYQWLWGKRYRQDYGVKINVPTVKLDTLYGGLTPVRKGGGHQSKSLRLKDKNGKEYVMRALRKNALQYLQAVAFKNENIKGQFDNTITENLLLDVFAGSHPYAPFTIDKLSEAVGIYHTNPKLYYVPKQNSLGSYNTDYGDELYMIEERATSGHGELSSFGYSNKIISTHDMLQKIQKNANHIVDEKSYLRARLFDMLIGDWDRHEDQWRWATFEKEGKTIYRPVPRDRDQAFSIMGDGFLLGTLTKIIPNLRLMKKYEEDLKSPKWFNLEPYSLDVALITKSNKTVWDKEVNYLKTHLSNQIIDQAFLSFPSEINQQSIAEIKRKLIGRRNHLQEISDHYFKHINKYAIIRGTNEKDYFKVERTANRQAKVTVYKIEDAENKAQIHQRVYSPSETKEIWLYGLNEEDVFEVVGAEKKPICVRIVGGGGNDVYTITSGKRVIIYDHKSKKNDFSTTKGKIKLTDDYETNTYDYKKIKNNANQLTPLFGFNPDDGVKISLSNSYKTYGFERNPFTTEHHILASYFFATQGFDFQYNAEFAKVIANTNLTVNARLTSPNYSINFFGFGNETVNPNFLDDTNFDLDFNRVKLSEFSVSPALVFRGAKGATLKGGIKFQTIEVEQTRGRFIDQINEGEKVDNRDSFIGVEGTYNYVNKDDSVFPTLGMNLNVTAGYTNNIDSEKSFTYLKPSLAFDHQLVGNGKIVLATKVGSHINFGNSFKFYQAANLGANNGLRGYRNQRFTGKYSLYHSTDLRTVLTQIKTAVAPLTVGVYGGVDYGRVWVSNDNSEKWNNSYGGGIFINASKIIVSNISLFTADENPRFSFKLGFDF